MWTRHASVCRQTVGTVGACALLPTGFALRRARCRRRWRRSVSLVPSAPVGYTARSSPSSLLVSPAQAYFTALLTERTGVPAWSDAPIDGARALLLHLRRGRLAALGSS